VATRVLVTDGEQRPALALVRSLGQVGYEVIVASHHALPLAGASRFASATVKTPDPLADPAGYVRALRDVTERMKIRVLVPTTEGALLAVLPARATFGDTIVPFTSADSFRRISDKHETLDVAASIGINVPAQVLVRSRAKADELDYGAIQFPVVLKPTRSVVGTEERRAKQGVGYATNPTELRLRLNALSPDTYPVLLQRRVTGPGVGIFLLVWKGELIASFSHRRLREKPPAGGVSVYCESIDMDPKLLEQSRRLLSHFSFEGVAMVEYKIDTATDVPYLMEVNARFWGSLQLAVDAGVDFPRLLLQVALGERVAPVSRYTLGVRSRWWWGDVDHLLTRLRRSAEVLGLPPGAPSRLRSVVDFLALWRPRDHNEVLRWSDPAPFWRESVNWFLRR